MIRPKHDHCSISTSAGIKCIQNAPYLSISKSTTGCVRIDEVDEERLVEILGWQQRRGVNGLFVCGTTGEGVSMTTIERMEVAQICVKHAPEVPVVVHVGTNAMKDVRALAAHADEIGASAIAAAPPSFFRPSHAEALYCAAEAAAAAETLPFYYYHIPSMTGVELDMEQFVADAIDRIPNFVGVKFTHNNLGEFERCVERFGDQAQMLFGRDELLLDSLKAGGVGAVGSTYNYAAPLYQKLIAAHRSGNDEEACEWQKRACAFIDVLIEYRGCAATKMFMQVCGLNSGNNRLPLPAFDQAGVDAMKAKLDQMGFFQWVESK
ncbi:dihydrodipicolinate synthase family protein [Verrucomicrobia bacterium]|nr:dihydrodipicolinate synthase family protein [Verrucomicrobiota bacterium]